MAERYNKLYTLPGNLYAPGSPVLISAGALLKDNQTGNVLCQLKFRNISAGTITALKVLVLGYDMSGEELCREEHQYLDLKISRNGSFGTREAIPLPVHSVRSYSARVLAVYFADGSRYFADEQPWEPLPELMPLRSRLFDRELIRQYRLDTSEKSEYVPMEYRDLWLCSCGEVNHFAENCFTCGYSLGDLQYLLNVDLLLEEKNERLKQEAVQAAERETSRAHSAKIIKRVLMVIIPLILLTASVWFFLDRSGQRENDYEMAGVLMAAEKYTEAVQAYDALGDYKDSRQKAADIRAILSETNAYEKAVKFLENGRYDDAYSAFTAMGEYEDAAELAKEALYRKALELANAGDCTAAQELFTGLEGYKDAAQLAGCFVELLVSVDTSYDPECEGPLTTNYTHDSSGRILTSTALYSAYPGLNDRLLEYSHNGDGSYSVTEGSTVRDYDTWGILLRENGQDVYVYDYGYYDDGGIYYVCAYNVEDMGFVSETVYDESGNPIRFTDAEGAVYTTVNEYDEKGLLVKVENFDAEGAFTDRTSYEYDDNGNLKRATYMDLNNVTAVTTYSYEVKFSPAQAD